MVEFWTAYVWPTIWIVILIIAIAVPLLLAIAYLTYAERKVIAAMQLRQGPMVVGPMGLLQPIADGLKLLVKETVLPSGANKVVFLLAPIVTFSLALIGWAVIPFGEGLVLADINVGVLYLLAISSLGVYGIIMAGWASNSRYAFLGALRSAAQMVSYEIAIGLIIISVLITVGSLNLSDIVRAQADLWFFIPHFPMFAIFVASILAETNRHPFDLPEAEAELVAGYNVEYSSMTFALFFLGEYGNMILMSAICAILFLGGWLPPFAIAPFTWLPGPIWFFLKIAFVLFIFIWARATLPRYRYDQLMRLGWKVFLPASLIWIVVTSGFLVATGRLPG
ncbi:MAG: NADH-quinone oxidoreductase subunit NuoH [Geminicoccaceae bacterium]